MNSHLFRGNPRKGVKIGIAKSLIKTLVIELVRLHTACTCTACRCKKIICFEIQLERISRSEEKKIKRVKTFLAFENPTCVHFDRRKKLKRKKIYCKAICNIV